MTDLGVYVFAVLVALALAMPFLDGVITIKRLRRRAAARSQRLQR
jgi:hypothetical protein